MILKNLWKNEFYIICIQQFKPEIQNQKQRN